MSLAVGVTYEFEFLAKAAEPTAPSTYSAQATAILTVLPTPLEVRFVRALVVVAPGEAVELVENCSSLSRLFFIAIKSYDIFTSEIGGGGGLIDFRRKNVGDLLEKRIETALFYA